MLIFKPTPHFKNKHQSIFHSKHSFIFQLPFDKRNCVHAPHRKEKSTMNTTPSITGLYITLFELDNVTIPEEGDTLLDPFTEYLLNAAIRCAFHAIHIHGHPPGELVFGRDLFLPKKQKYRLYCNPRTETKNNCKQQSGLDITKKPSRDKKKITSAVGRAVDSRTTEHKWNDHIQQRIL